MTADELKTAGERINNMKKLFNLREGWLREDDTLPGRALFEELVDGVGKGATLSREDLDMMIASYYRVRGWTADGGIPASKLEELGLELIVPASETTAV
jgi:aldehyde:ferredoxin oxidoreductase